MRIKNYYLLMCLFCLLGYGSLGAQTNKSLHERWSEEQAQQWYAQQPWYAGCDYITATAINQIEMWSKESFDAKQIDKELTWAQRIGRISCIFE